MQTRPLACWWLRRPVSLPLLLPLHNVFRPRNPLTLGRGHRLDHPDALRTTCCGEMLLWARKSISPQQVPAADGLRSGCPQLSFILVPFPLGVRERDDTADENKGHAEHDGHLPRKLEGDTFGDVGPHRVSRAAAGEVACCTAMLQILIFVRPSKLQVLDCSSFEKFWLSLVTTLLLNYSAL